MGGNFSYDKNGEFYSTTKIYGYVKKLTASGNYLFWLGVLNSKLFWFFIKTTGYVLRGGYYTFKTNYTSPFPVPINIPIELEEKIVFCVSEILKKEELIEKWQSKIDSHVYELYSLTADEIRVVERLCSNEISAVQ